MRGLTVKEYSAAGTTVDLLYYRRGSSHRYKPISERARAHFRIFLFGDDGFAGFPREQDWSSCWGFVVKSSDELPVRKKLSLSLGEPSSSDPDGPELIPLKTKVRRESPYEVLGFTPNRWGEH